MRKQRLFRKITLTVAVVVLVVGLMPGLVGAQGGAQGGAFLGVRIRPTDDGALIAAIIPGTGAEAAGLQVGDLITAVDGDPVDGDYDLSATIGAHEVGDTIVVTVLRDDETLEIEATLGVEPAGINDGATPGGSSGTIMTRHYSFAGATFAVAPGGWQVVEVREDMLAAEAGLQAGDVVTTLNGDPVTDLSLGRVSGTVAGGGEIVLGVLREGESLDITFELEPGSAIQSFQAEVEVTIPATPEVEEARPENPPPIVAAPAEEPRGFLGVSFVTLTPDILADAEADLSITLTVEQGGLVVEVLEDTPAAEAGLEPGDVITAVNGDVVDAERTLADRIYPYEAGDTVSLTVQRGDETLTVETTLIPRPPEMTEAIPLPLPINPGALNDFFDENPDLLPQFQALLEQFARDGDPGPLFEFLAENGLDVPLPLAPLPPDDDSSEGPSEDEGSGPGGLVIPHMGMFMDLFMDPDFDWDAFLEEHPELGALMEQFEGEFDPEAFQQFMEEHPNLMPFGMFLRPFGRGGMHFDMMGPDFDWDAFLEEHPAMGEMMERMFGEGFDPERLGEMFPFMPGRGGRFGERHNEAEAAPETSG